MSFLKPREPRQSVSFNVRLRVDTGWQNARITNVSSRGMRLHSESPPAKGSYVEIRRGSYTVVGRVVWVKEASFGIRSQDRILLSELADDTTATSAHGRDRRKVAREVIEVTTRSPTLAEREAASARAARLFDFAAMVAIIIGVSWLIFDISSSALKGPLDDIDKAMATSRR